MDHLLQKFALVFFFILSFGAFSKNHVIFNIAQEVPLDDATRPIKNFYINMGQNQGVQEGVILDVFRVVSRIDPYEAKKHYNFKVKIGELKILHSEDDSAIGGPHSFTTSKDALYFEVDGIMIGDHVAVKIDP